MEDEELVKVSMSHVLEDHALGLLLETNSNQADDVRVPQVSHQLGLADKVLPSLLVGSGLQRLDRNEAGHSSDGAVAGQLALVDLAKGALTQLLEEPDGGEGQLHGASLGLLLLLPRGQERSHLHVGLASTVLPAKIPKKQSDEETVLNMSGCHLLRDPAGMIRGFAGGAFLLMQQRPMERPRIATADIAGTAT